MVNAEKLQALIDTAKALIDKQATESDGEFFTWHEKAIRVLTSIYGKQSDQYKSFEQITFKVTWAYISTTANDSKIKACAMGLVKSIGILSSYLEEMKENDTEETEVVNYDFSKVFIVHGHDSQLKESVARLVDRQQHIEAIILSEQRNRGKTLIEKLEKHSDVGGAICLFSADDVGREKDEKRGKPRARQNVVFEAGYFMGKLGRDHIIIIADKAVELPSDLNGILYTDKESWKHDVLAELEEMGYDIDFSKE